MDDLEKLKQEKNALIIAHYYQEPEIQDVADYVGDSLGMALYAKKQKCRIAVVAGVRFMAETIKVLNPDKKILLPDSNAGCSLADSCTPEVFSYFLSKHPGAFVMTYVNSSLEIKALSDVICTSSNALKIASQIPADRQIVFGPDQHLGRFIMKKLGRPLILFPGNCFVHMSFSAKEMVRLKERFPDAAIIAHPECEESVLSHAEFVGSTSQLLKYTKESPKKKFIVMTEAGIIHQMKKLNPDKEYIVGPDLEGCSCNECPHMKLNTLEKVTDCLEREEPEMIVKPALAKAAMKPLQKMVEMTGSPA
ncbi:MAG: quinolinate synthase NadA [Deltaproteobacteria bacterium]|nr:quinolinate synthase NadA [Deltaproteobacteria bacterium]